MTSEKLIICVKSDDIYFLIHDRLCFSACLFNLNVQMGQLKIEHIRWGTSVQYVYVTEFYMKLVQWCLKASNLATGNGVSLARATVDTSFYVSLRQSVSQ